MEIHPSSRGRRGVVAAWAAVALLAGFPVHAQAQTSPDSTAPTAGGDEDAGRERGGSIGGYLDSAIPLSLFRLRYSAGYDNNRPDRAEFFYSQYRQQTTGAVGGVGGPVYVNTVPASGNAVPVSGNGRGGPGPNRGGNDVVTVTAPNSVVGNPNARGLRQAETSVDFQDVSSYLEYAFSNTFSGFVEAPVRFLNPDVNENVVGFGDMNTGFKWAFVSQPNLFATFQLRAYVPTGAASRGLGTHHASLEPSLLFWSHLTDRFFLEGQGSIWAPIAGTDFEGTIISYGLAASYLAYQSPGGMRVFPVIEGVGWSVLNGKETTSLGGNTFQIRSAVSDEIFNLKAGVRVRFTSSDFYVGYGRPMTGEVWYKNFMRAEFRIYF